MVVINVNQPGNGSWPFVALDTILNVPESHGIYFHLTGVSMPNGNVYEQPDAQAAKMSSHDAALALNNARRVTQAISDETTDKTTDGTTSQSTKPPNNGSKWLVIAI